MKFLDTLIVVVGIIVVLAIISAFHQACTSSNSDQDTCDQVVREMMDYD